MPSARRASPRRATHRVIGPALALALAAVCTCEPGTAQPEGLNAEVVERVTGTAPEPAPRPGIESETVTATATGPLPESAASAGPIEVDPPETLLEADGLLLESQNWRFQGVESGTAWRVRVALSAAIEVVPSEALAAFADFLPDDDGPWAVINGGFYDDSLRPMGLVVAHGQVHAPLQPGGGSGVFLVDAGGPRVIHRDDWEPGPGVAVQSVDRLIEGGVSLVRSRVDRRAARSAVVVGERHLWLIAVAGQDSVRPVDDGVWLRWTSRRGLPLWAFAEYILATTDVVSALNLDGGGSTNLSAQAAGRRVSVTGERGTVNAILVRP